MIRNTTLEEISDGILYTSRDMVKVGCNDCAGCSQCCHVVGNSIILDPMDAWNLTKGLNVSFETLIIQGMVELNVIDGVILPNISISDESKGCSFLDGNGRCKIHSFRPGFCRMFPLGRYYDDDKFWYILQINECPKPGKTKVKVKNWLGIDNLLQYEDFSLKWHNFVKNIQQFVEDCDDVTMKRINEMFLNIFYLKTDYQEKDFYDWFEETLKEWQKMG